VDQEVHRFVLVALVFQAVQAVAVAVVGRATLLEQAAVEVQAKVHQEVLEVLEQLDQYVLVVVLEVVVLEVGVLLEVLGQELQIQAAQAAQAEQDILGRSQQLHMLEVEAAEHI
jgi:hypothetical protein